MLTTGSAVPAIESSVVTGMFQNVATHKTSEISNEGTLLRVLVVDDDETIRSVCHQILLRNDADAVCARTLADAEAMLRDQRFDLLLLDMKLPDGSGISLLQQVKIHYSDMAVVVMTAFATVSSAVEAMRIGASDYITKPFAMEELTTILQRARQHANYTHEKGVLRAKLRSHKAENELIGRSAEMEKLHRLLTKVTFSTHPVLILGENGTGKEVLARSIHFNGPNANQPFVVVNCDSNLIECELFGDENTLLDSVDSKNGVLAAAEGGTVCLDEISELSPDAQAKLLRTLQEKKVRPIGGGRAKPISARILASSSRDLASMVEQGKFRRDLYFRLNVMSLKIPALRQRTEDISLLAKHFLAAHDEQDNVQRTLSADAIQMLNQYEWPGNVRELENAIKHACALSNGSTLNVDDFPPQLRDLEAAVDAQDRRLDNLTPIGNQVDVVTPKRRDIIPIAEMERQAILGTIDELGGDKVMAAKLLGIGKTTLYRKLKEYGMIDLDAEPVSA
jgi:two-component system response regulator HydG